MKSEEIRTDVIKPVECFKEGWGLIKDYYWILFAITIVGVMVGGVTIYILTGAMVCGIFKCFLNVIDGGKPEFDILFSNIKKFFVSGFVVMIVMVVPMIIVFSLIYIPIIVAAYSGQAMSEEELLAMMTGAFAVEFVVAIVMVCLHTLLMFAFPLIADKNLSGWEAIKTSAKAVWMNLTGVTGLWVVGFVVSLAGLLLFCIGIYFTIPIIIAGNTVAYRKIFPLDKPINDDPGSLNAFENVGTAN